MAQPSDALWNAKRELIVLDLHRASIVIRSRLTVGNAHLREQGMRLAKLLLDPMCTGLAFQLSHPCLKSSYIFCRCVPKVRPLELVQIHSNVPISASVSCAP